MAPRRPGEWIGPYQLISVLGEGGNAVVWLAQPDDGEPVALKVLRVRNPSSEQYRRFAREVDVQRKLTLEAFPGVLPVIDAAVPRQPSRVGPAWLAMRRAERLDVALGDAPRLDVVVEAFHDFAETLARLAARTVFHRDIKPSNLYRYDAQWVVGDFGLVKVPEAEPLTTGAKGLGPRHFLAPEMLATPDIAEGGPADVYSLAKTLWVSATGQRVPVPGEQRVDVAAHRMSSYAAHPRAALLDGLIERATRTEPSRRPAMGEVAEELAAWSREPAPSEQAADLGQLGAELDAVLKPTRRADEELEARNHAARRILEELDGVLSAVAARLEDVGLPRLPGNRGDAQNLLEAFGSNWFLRYPELSDVRFIKVGREIRNESQFLDYSPRSLYLWTAVTIRSDRDGYVVMGAGYGIGRTAEHPLVVWREHAREAMGSASQLEAIAKLRNGLLENLPKAVQEMIQRLRPGAG